MIIIFCDDIMLTFRSTFWHTYSLHIPTCGPKLTGSNSSTVIRLPPSGTTDATTHPTPNSAGACRHIPHGRIRTSASVYTTHRSGASPFGPSADTARQTVPRFGADSNGVAGVFDVATDVDFAAKSTPAKCLPVVADTRRPQSTKV